MTRPAQSSTASSDGSFRIALLLGCALMMLISPSAQAQTFTVLHTFSGPDGLYPYSGVTLDRAGNLYGTTYGGGANRDGTVYQLKRAGASYIHNQLHAFTGGSDGEQPYGGVIFGPDGALYGTTSIGGFEGGGTVFSLRPPVTICRSVLCPWTETVLYSVANLNGVQPGNLYGGTTSDGFVASVFELSPSGNGWQITVLHTFQAGSSDGPWGNLVLDSNGNLYGTTKSLGTFGLGNIFKLSPSGNGWTYTDLYDFSNNGDGEFPTGDLTIDGSGNIYGTNMGENGHGVVWKLTP